MDCESFLESNFLDIVALCETKDFTTHIHGPAVYVNEGLPFAQNLSPESSAGSYLRFRLALLYSVSYFFFFYRLHRQFLILFQLT